MLPVKLRLAKDPIRVENGYIRLPGVRALLFVAVIVGLCSIHAAIDSKTSVRLSRLMAFSMDVQNGAALVLIPDGPPATAMTGNTHASISTAAELLAGFTQVRRIYPANANQIR
jgi:uncharacterized membrane protein YoaK (UPF0700 family)